MALTYASRGWPVFPCRPGSKEPATAHGFRDATTDPDQIRSWWARWPDANLAIATGTAGPDVLDVDEHAPAGNGFAALLRLKGTGLLDEAGAAVRRPHGGLHLYFSGSGQARQVSTGSDAGRLAAWVERLEEGNRNAGLFWAACRAVESGQADVLGQIAAAAEKTGLTEPEIGRTIASARRGITRSADRQLNREATR